jgi:hypothetical protein
MINILIAFYFIASSFLTGAFYESNNSKSGVADVITYIVCFLFGPFVVALTILKRLYKFINK